MTYRYFISYVAKSMTGRKIVTLQAALTTHEQLSEIEAETEKDCGANVITNFILLSTEDDSNNALGKDDV